MTVTIAPQSPQVRLARHYLEKLQQASATIHRGHASRSHWLGRIEQDWGQIKQWQDWSAAGARQDTSRARLCADFPTAAGDVLRIRTTTAEQIAWVEQALDAARHLGDGGRERALLYQLGSHTLTAETPDRTETVAAELAALAEAADDRHALGRGWFLTAAAHFVRGAYEKAEAILHRARPALEACNAQRELGQVSLTLGRLANVRGDYETARRYYLEYLHISEATDHELAVIEANISLAGVNLSLNAPEKADAYARTAVSMARPLGVSRFLPPALFALAHVQRTIGEYAAASHAYEEGIGAARAISAAPSSIANGLHGLALARARQGDADAALTHLEEALGIVREARYPLRVCEAASDCAILYARKGMMERAEARVREALESAATLGTPQYMALALAAAAMVWAERGDDEQAALWAGALQPYAEMISASLYDAARFGRPEAAHGEAMALGDAVQDALGRLEGAGESA